MSSVATGRPPSALTQLLVEQVADLALALGAEHVERVGRDRVVGVALQREQPDLRAVAVGDDHLVLGGELGDRGDGGRDVAALASASAGSPRRSRALPPSAITMRMADHSHSPVMRA